MVSNISNPRPDTISTVSKEIPLLESEKIAREREHRDGTLQKSVLEQIEATL